MAKPEPILTYTVNNEPYLGRTSVHGLDNLLIAMSQANREAAANSHTMKKDDLLDAACVLVASAVSIAYSIRELIRQGYLLSALILLRPLAERTVTLVWLKANPDKVTRWFDGKKLPTLAHMVESIAGDKQLGIGSEFTKEINDLVHGNAETAYHQLIFQEDGSMAYSSGRILDRPDLCDTVASQCQVWVNLLGAHMHAMFIPSKTN